MRRLALAALGALTLAACQRADNKPTPPPTAPDETGLVGTELPRWTFTDWTNSEPLSLDALRGRVVVVRFWTAPSCPFCAKSMPALQSLSRELVDRPVTFIGAYHAKPVGNITDYLTTAKDWGVTFPLALDRRWKTLRAWWLSTGQRDATSVTFVIDKTSRVAFVHPGPVFHPSDNPAEAEQNRDYLAVRQAIVDALSR